MLLHLGERTENLSGVIKFNDRGLNRIYYAIFNTNGLYGDFDITIEYSSECPETSTTEQSCNGVQLVPIAHVSIPKEGQINISESGPMGTININKRLIIYQFPQSPKTSYIMSKANYFNREINKIEFEDLFNINTEISRI